VKARRRVAIKIFNYFNKLYSLIPKKAKTDLICEKILDFLNAFPYIHPEIFVWSFLHIWNNNRSIGKNGPI